MAAWGPVEFVSRRLPFDWTTYYEPEMGPGLSRHFVLFRDAKEQECLPKLKNVARQVEATLLNFAGGRRVNVDPGFLTPERLLLATTKPCAHRPYLGDGIYADLTLVFHQRSYQPLRWTYPDYAADDTIVLLNTLRAQSLLQRHALGRGTRILPQESPAGKGF